MRLLTVLLAVCACGRSAPYSYADAPPILPTPDAGIDAGIDWCSSGVNGGCSPNALCTNHPAGRSCACKPGYEGDGFVCTSIAAKLDGLRWELPCVKPEPQAPDYVCITTGDQSFSTTLSGVPGRSYDIRLRIRGVVETKFYVNGPTDGGYWAVGVTPTNDAWNVYQLTLSSPPVKYFLNHGPSGLYQCVGIDYTVTVRAAAGSTFTLFASAVDSNLSEIRNNVASPIVVPGIPPAPKAYDGQFIQMDVLGVVEVP